MSEKKTYYIVRFPDGSVKMYTRIPRPNAPETIELTVEEWRTLMDALPHVKKVSHL